MLRSSSFVATALLASALTACSALPGLVPTRTPGGPVVEQIYVASVRAREPDGGFSNNRSETITYTSYDVSIPPTHVPAQGPRYEATQLDPARDFIALGSEEFGTATAFNRAVVNASTTAPAEALVYVHGFNTGYSDSVYQLAQIGTDIDIPAARVLYSWPSQTQLSGYVHDLDSAVFARDGLEQVLNGLAASGVRRIVVVGYSMGATLVVETLRQMKLAGSPQFFARLGGVVLLSPDMDIDVFKAQAKRMGGLPQPFIVYASPDYGPLRAFSQFFGKGAPRLGALADPDGLADIEMTFIDVTNIPTAKQPGHLPVATAPSMIAAINAMPKPDIVLYGQQAAAGAVPGTEIRHFGKLTYVLLPKPAR